MTRLRMTATLCYDIPARYPRFPLVRQQRSAAQRLSPEPHGQRPQAIFLSVASLWETAIKISMGKLRLSAPFETFIPQHLAVNQVQTLDLTFAHLVEVSRLPLHHRDPFDRLIIAQAITENLPIISIDDKFDAYPVRRRW